MASRASEKMNKSPCSSRCWPSGHAAGKRPLRHALLHGIFFFVLLSELRLPQCREPHGIYTAGRALGCGPGGTLPSGHAGRYSSCHSGAGPGGRGGPGRRFASAGPGRRASDRAMAVALGLLASGRRRATVTVPVSQAVTAIVTTRLGVTTTE